MVLLQERKNTAGCRDSEMSIKSEMSSGRNGFYYGFDYLRAIMPIGVVALHMEVFGRHTLHGPQEYRSHIFSLPDLINYQVLCLAVPIFFLVSLFLFSEKAHNNRGYFLRRAERLVYIYIFWLTLFILWRGGMHRMLPVYDVKHFVILVMSGGPSAFYFFFSLLFLTCIAFFALKLPRRILWLFLAVSVMLLWFMPYLVFRTDLYSSLVAAWNPANFLVYVFVAVLVSKYRAHSHFSPSLKSFRIMMLVLTLVFLSSSVFEWHWMVNERNFASNQHIIPPYTRLSVAAGSSLIFLLSLYISRPPASWIKFLSDYSLGLYCFHLFIIEMNDKIMSMLRLSANIAVKFLMVLIVSYAFAYFAKRAFSKGLV